MRMEGLALAFARSLVQLVSMYGDVLYFLLVKTDNGLA